MSPLLLKAGIGQKRIDYVTRYLDQYSVEESQECLDWILEIRTGAYNEVKRIYEMPGDVTLWDRYEQFQLRDLPEQKLFAVASTKLKQEWAFAYRPNRKFHVKKEEISNDSDSESTDGVGVRSE